MISSPQAMMHSGRAEHAAKAARYYLMSGGLYLNIDGSKLQSGRRYAWTGTVEQARAIRRTSSAAAGCKAINVRATVPTPLQEEAL